MVQGISVPGFSPFVAPAKPVTPAQPPVAAGLEAGSAPAPAPGVGRPVDAPAAPDGDKRQADERGRDRPIPLAPTHLSIARDEKADVFVYRGVDEGSQVKAQWPSEDALRRIAALRELLGKIIDKSL